MRRALALIALTACSAHAQPPAAASCPPQLSAPSAEQLQAARRDARDRGALWRITRDDRTSYLYATIHVGKLEWAVPGPRVSEALAATDTVALELDPTDASLMSRLTGSQPPAAPLSDELRARISRGMEALCLPAEARPLLAGMHPMMLAMTLSVLEGRWVGLDPGYGQEFVLAGFARATQRRIVSMETPELQLAAIIPDTEAAIIKAVRSALDQLEQGKARRAIALLAAAWERGDLDTMAAYERWCECVLDDEDRRQMRRLLDDRHPGLADRIDALCA